MIKGINIDQALFRHLKKSIFTFKPYVYIFQAYKGSEGIDLNQARSYDDEDRVKRPRIDPGMKQHSLLFREAAKKVSQLVARLYLRGGRGVNVGPLKEKELFFIFFVILFPIDNNRYFT